MEVQNTTARKSANTRAVIVAGAKIGDYRRIKNFLKGNDKTWSSKKTCDSTKTCDSNKTCRNNNLYDENFFIFCDSGLKHARKLGVKPNLIVGDFDSYTKTVGRFHSEVIALPREKDDTDSFFAAKEALQRGYKNFLIIGAVGQRFDHTVANISMLLYLHTKGCHAELLDDFSRMYFISDKPAVIYGDESKSDEKTGCKYFSTINFDGSAHGITIRGAKYPLENAEIRPEYQYGISNEVLPGQTAEVTVENGALLVVENLL